MNILIAALVLAALGGSPDLQSVLDDMRESQDVPGISAVIVSKLGVVFAGASGVANLESSERMTADSVIYAGSLSKLLTAALVLQLVEQGSLSLADEVDGIGDGSRSVTVEHLLTHSAGLPREGDFGYWFSADFPDATELAGFLATTDLRSAPGESLHYSNIGYAALGSVVEQVTEQTFDAALRERVIEPLDMNASGARGPASGVANGYTPTGRIIPSADRPFAGVGRQVGNRHVRMYHDARAMSPAFGAYTSASDLGRLAQFLLGCGNDAVLSVAMRQHMFEIQPSGWGLGIRIESLNGRTVARHGGWFAAHRSHLLLDIDMGIGIVVMANADNADPAAIAEELLRTIFASRTTARASQCGDKRQSTRTDGSPRVPARRPPAPGALQAGCCADN